MKDTRPRGISCYWQAILLTFDAKKTRFVSTQSNFPYILLYELINLWQAYTLTCFITYLCFTSEIFSRPFIDLPLQKLQESCLILTHKTLRLEILFSSCCDGYKHGNHSTLATDSAVLWAGRSAISVRALGTRLQLREAACTQLTPPRARARRPDTRGTKEPTGRKSDFPFSGVWRNCPSGCDSDHLKLHVGSTQASRRFFPFAPLSLSFALSLFSQTASSTAHRKLDAYYFTHFRLSPFFLPLFFLWSSLRESTMFLTLIHPLYFYRTSLHAFSNSPILTPSVFITFYRRRINCLF